MIARSRSVLFALTLAVASLAAPTPTAEAQFGGWEIFQGNTLGGVIAILSVASVVGVAEVVLIGADVVSWAVGTPFDDGWAVFDLVIGSLWTTAGSAGFVVAALLWDLNTDGLAVVSAGALGLGALHIAHGLWSLATNDPPPPVIPTVAVSADGATFAVTGSF